MDPVDQLAFVVGLQEADGQAQILGQRAKGFGDVIQRLAPIDFGLAAAQQVQVRTVEDIDRFGQFRASLGLAAGEDRRGRGWRQAAVGPRTDVGCPVAAEALWPQGDGGQRTDAQPSCGRLSRSDCG